MLFAIVAATRGALADGSSVSPTRLVFANGQGSRSLLITNTSGAPRRYSVAAYAWDENDADPIALSDTNDVVFFPGSFTIGSLQSQRIRVGMVNTQTSTENAYRIVVSELPPLEAVLGSQSSGLAFTTSFSVPIYVAPSVPLYAGEVDDVSLDRNKLHFVIYNTGNVHFVATKMRVSAAGESGVILATENSSWFVLAKKKRAFDIPIPHGSCTAIRTVSIRVEAATVAFDRTLDPPRSCR